MKDCVILQDATNLKQLGFRYHNRSLSYVHDTWGSVAKFDLDIASKVGFKCLLLEYDPGSIGTPPYIKVKIGDRITKLPAIAAKNFVVSANKRFFSGIVEKPLSGYHKFTIIPSKGVLVGGIELKRHQADKLMWYLIGYIGAEKVFKKLAHKLDYEIED